MKVHVVVKYTDVETIDPKSGEETYITETVLLDAYGSRQDAKIEAKHLNAKRTDDNIQYDVQELELY